MKKTVPLWLFLAMAGFFVLLLIGFFAELHRENAERRAEATETSALPTQQGMIAGLRFGMPSREVEQRFGEPAGKDVGMQYGLTQQVWHYRCADGQVSIDFGYSTELLAYHTN